MNGPRSIDFELSHLARSANIRQKVMLAVDHARQPRDLKTSLILSSHDFEGRPNDLVRRAAAMWNEPACAVAKIVWKARSVRDCIEAFELLQQAPKPTIALCMGAFGMASRVLAAKFGGFLTYARAQGDPGTAPGQPTVPQLRELYCFDSITPRTRVFGVVGWPIEHSLSPHLHNAGFGSVKFDGVYLPLPVPPEWEHFKATLHALLDFKPLDLGGLSVTLPHKQHLVRFVRVHAVDEVLVAVPWRSTAYLQDLVKKLKVLPNDVKLCPEYVGSSLPVRGVTPVAGEIGRAHV